jgi:hypothetical protein
MGKWEIMHYINGIAQEVMEYVPTITYGKQNRKNSKRKRQ